FGLMGANGGGKTTLLRILATLLLPDGGKASVNGYDVITQPGEVKMSIGYCYEGERSFYFRLTGRQNLEFFAALQNLSGRRLREEVARVLDLLELSAFADRLFMEYSTGMRQRLNLARALLNDPPVLLLDEPTKSLDPIAAQHFRKFLKEKVVKEGNKTVLIATHSLEEAQYLCDRIAIIEQGRVVAEGNYQRISAYLQNKGETK
ncbi:MAG: ABC transporter ATP-binding protein, partial [candidate division WOR-3 bacterium]